VGRKALVRKPEPKRGIAGPRWTGFRGMTVRNWLPIVGALLILIMVALGIGWITWQQAKFEDRRAEQAQKIENQRAEAERELAEQRAQDEALQAYLNQMSGLLLERDLRASEKGSGVRILARAQTLTVLESLDPSGKTALMQFLVEADLVQRVEGRDPIISLHGADLSDADLSDSRDLSGANLVDTYLSGASLIDADLSSASLIDADLSHADLRYADLSDADLSDAVLRYAVLRYAYLGDAVLSGAELGGADLSGADLSDADLSDAYLGEANLIGAKGVTNEQLRAARFLEGATMPNGQKYEEWLKSKDQGENKKSDGSS
jgi:uncharacterized protein YjbI with pentapeptide repeats